MAIENIYRPLWSERILEELGYNEESRLIDRGAAPHEAHARAIHLIDQMRNAFDDSCVAGWEPLEGNYGLPDPDDEHVVAAAHMAGAGAIVTSNVRDFPRHLLPKGLDIQEPAAFAAYAVDVDPVSAARAVETIAGRSGRRGSLMTPEEVLERLDRLYEFQDATAPIRALLL